MRRQVHHSQRSLGATAFFRFNVPKQGKNDYACGSACLAGLMRSSGVQGDATTKGVASSIRGLLRSKKLRSALDPEKRGLKHEHVEKIARELGLPVCWVRRGVSPDALMRLVRSNSRGNLRSILMVMIWRFIQGGWYPHYVLLYGASRNRLFIADPYPEGARCRRVSRRDLAVLMSGVLVGEARHPNIVSGWALCVLCGQHPSPDNV